nr:hypothetical protein [uncultured Aminipila sp.]
MLQSKLNAMFLLFFTVSMGDRKADHYYSGGATTIHPRWEYEEQYAEDIFNIKYPRMLKNKADSQNIVILTKVSRYWSHIS